MDTEPLDRHQRTLATRSITSSENLQWIHLISRQQPPQQQSTKSIDLNMLNLTNLTETQCKKAKLQAGIKPTALCSAIDKENLIESPLDFVTLYIQVLS